MKNKNVAFENLESLAVVYEAKAADLMRHTETAAKCLAEIMREAAEIEKLFAAVNAALQIEKLKKKRR